MVEDIKKGISEFKSENFNEYSAGLLDLKEISVITEIPERPLIKEKLLQRFNNGSIVLGIKKNGSIVAYSWLNTHNSTYKGLPFKMKKNEAYIFDTYTLSNYRGNGIASYAHYEFYKILYQSGKTRLYSISDIFNKSAVSFKRKLGAEFVLLGLYINIFRRWKFRTVIKRFLPEKEYV